MNLLELANAEGDLDIIIQRDLKPTKKRFLADINATAYIMALECTEEEGKQLRNYYLTQVRQLNREHVTKQLKK